MLLRFNIFHLIVCDLRTRIIIFLRLLSCLFSVDCRRQAYGVVWILWGRLVPKISISDYFSSLSVKVCMENLKKKWMNLKIELVLKLFEARHVKPAFHWFEQHCLKMTQNIRKTPSFIPLFFSAAFSFCEKIYCNFIRFSFFLCLLTILLRL